MDWGERVNLSEEGIGHLEKVGLKEVCVSIDDITLHETRPVRVDPLYESAAATK
jgi:hypothetical protein